MQLSVFLYSRRWMHTFFVFMFWDHLRRCPLIIASQLGDKRRALVWSPFLVEQAMLSLKRTGWSFDVLPDDAVVSDHHQTTNIPNCLHAGLGLRPSVTSFTYRSPLSHRYWAWKFWWRPGRGLIFSICAMKFFGGVQCVQYWPHPLHSWFICHVLASRDADGKVLGL